MYCKNCGEEIDDKAAICVKCGVYTQEKKKKNVTFAFIWAFLIGGAGQCYNGEWGKGALVFIGSEILACFALFLALVMPSSNIVILLTISLLIWIAGMIDAVSVAQKINKGE